MSLVYAKTKIELSGTIWPSAIYDENHIGQLHDWLYRCGLCRKQIWDSMTNRTWPSLWQKPNRTMTWSIIYIWFTPKSKLNYLDLFDRMRSMRKTRQDNNVTGYIGAVYIENDTQLFLLIESGADYEENHIGQLCDWLYKCNLRQKRNWAVTTDLIRSSLWRQSNKTTTGQIT